MKNLRDSLTTKKKKKIKQEVISEPDEADRAPARPELIEASKAKLRETIKEEPAVSKVVKKAARLADMITDDDRIAAKRVIREAMNAEGRFYDHANKRLDVHPDHKTRLAAATLQLAYDEGLPVKRSIELRADVGTADEALKALRESPEAMKALQALSGLGLHLEAGGEVIDIETEQTES